MSDKPWYHEGLRFKCTGCGACCTGDPGYVWVNKAEIELLAKTVDMSAADFKKTFTRKVGIRRSLIELANGDCVLFDRITRHCKVYKARPRQCRTWPFWRSNLRSLKTWEETCRECSGAGRGPLVSADQIEAQQGITTV